MSRVGKLPIKIPGNVVVQLDGFNVRVDGPVGSISKRFCAPVVIGMEDGLLKVSPTEDTQKSIAMSGTVRSILNNMVKGVSVGFERFVEMVGVGYKANIKNGFLTLALAKSHNTIIEVPLGINISLLDSSVLKLVGCDNEKLGSFVALLRQQRPPEPYKGKGIRERGQYVYRKEGKKGK